MHVILTGATGTVGLPALRHALSHPNITKLSILSRRDFALPSPSSGSTSEHWNPDKAEIIVHKDFSSYPPEVLEKLKGAEAVVWAQGISQTQVSKDEYIRITNTYPLAAARAFTPLSPTGKFIFVHVSGEGADQTEKAYSFFGKIKGRTERQLIELSNSQSSSSSPQLRVYNVRPGYVDPQGEPNPGRSLFKRIAVDGIIGPTFRTLTPSLVSPTPVLSKVLVDLALSDGAPLPEGKGIEDSGRTIRVNGIARLGKA